MPVVLRRWLIFLFGCAPFIWILQAIIRVQSGEWDLLGPEPGKAIVWFTGTWAFNFLLLTLAVTPLCRLLHWRWLMVHRRMLGLFTFFYASLHLIAYFMFLLEWRWTELISESVERPYLLVGVVAWLLLLTLAVTSTRSWMRRLGRRWKLLHQAVYLIALLASVHYLLQIRASWLEPAIYTTLVVILLTVRGPLIKNKRIKFTKSS